MPYHLIYQTGEPADPCYSELAGAAPDSLPGARAIVSKQHGLHASAVVTRDKCREK